MAEDAKPTNGKNILLREIRTIVLALVAALAPLAWQRILDKGAARDAAIQDLTVRIAVLTQRVDDLQRWQARATRNPDGYASQSPADPAPAALNP